MGSDQHFCLRWNNFHSNIAASFEHLRDHEEFVDVTLACEGRSLKAHKIVLSACSPYFKNLLKQNPCQHPIIILRDVAFPDLSALLSFVYQGEVYVSQDRLPAFLRTAEMLHIKGLTEQNQNHHPHTGPGIPVTIGPPSTTTILQATHDQGILSNKVSSVGSVAPPSSPPSPSAHLHHLPLHISPPPKKRRSATTITALPSGSPTAAAPTSSTPPRMEMFAAGGQDPHGGAPLPLEGSTLAAALTKPLPPPVTSRSELIVTPSRVSSQPPQPPPPPLPPLPSSVPPSALPLSTPEVPKVKQETQDADDVKEEELLTATEEAVNLMTEGSILRQRIQGLRVSPDVPLPPQQHSSLLSHEESSTDEGFTGGDAGGELGVEGTEQEKEAMAGSPMVIRSPLMGLLPREAPGLFGGAGTSGSLSHQESSQDLVLNLSTGCSPKDTKKWPSRQPVNCQFCGVRISMAFNLRNHVKRCKMRPFPHSTGQSIRGSTLPCVPQAHQQQSQPEEAPEDSALCSGGGQVSPLPQTVPQQVLPVDPHQLISPRGQNATLPPPHANPLTQQPTGILVSVHSSPPPNTTIFAPAATTTASQWGQQ